MTINLTDFTRKLGKCEVMKRLKLRCFDDFTAVKDVAHYIEETPLPSM